MKRIYLIIFLIIATACQEVVEKPKNTLSEEEMSEIIADIYLYKQTPDNLILTPQETFNTYALIFNKYNITKEIFQENFMYYYINTKSMSKIYDKTIKILEEKLSSEEKQKLLEEIRKSLSDKNEQD